MKSQKEPKRLKKLLSLMANYISTPTGNLSFGLGEGPSWNPKTKQVSVVNIFEKEVHLFTLSDTTLTKIESFQTEGDVGAALPLEGGSFLLCEAQGIFIRHSSGERTKISALPVSGEQFRCNDAKVGPDGKLWVGIMDYDATEGKGSLWRIGRDGKAQLLLPNLTIPNGLDWLGDEFWFVDGPTEEIRCYNWDEAGLTSTDKRFVTNGTPDGLAIDANGEIWLALWGQARVDHFNKQGDVIDSVSVASSHSTSLCFAGENLDTLVMTSALMYTAEDELTKFPRAGDLFTCQVSTTGRQANLAFR